MQNSENSPNQNGQNSNKKTLFIKDLSAGDSVCTRFLIRQKQTMTNKNGKPYLALLLSDKTGDLEGRVWEGSEQMALTFSEGDVVTISGRVNLFQNRMQISVEHLVPVSQEEIDLKDYLSTPSIDIDALYTDLLKTFENLRNPFVKELGLALLRDPEIAKRYKICPAAKTIHHAFIGGLLSHSMQLIRLVDSILPLYEDIDRDLMVFGCAFHDFGKIYELHTQGRMGYTDEGRLVGHIAIGITLIDRKIQSIPEFPEELEWHIKHLILSHHGHLEYGSPKRPHTIEAELLHLVDHMDSRINSIQTFMRNDKVDARWTGYHQAYDQYYFKPEKYL